MTTSSRRKIRRHPRQAAKAHKPNGLGRGRRKAPVIEGDFAERIELQGPLYLFTPAAPAQTITVAVLRATVDGQRRIFFERDVRVGIVEPQHYAAVREGVRQKLAQEITGQLERGVLIAASAGGKVETQFQKVVWAWEA